MKRFLFPLLRALCRLPLALACWGLARALAYYVWLYDGDVERDRSVRGLERADIHRRIIWNLKDALARLRALQGTP